jgi:RNA polymerase sigma-70 factor (ECF subfamily)
MFVTMDADDAELLVRWRAGDREAGDRLFERYFLSVFRFFASKLGDTAAADLTQRTFLAVVESRDRVREGARMRAYVLTVARRELLMFFRARGRHGIDAELAQSCADELLPSPPSALAIAQEERLVVRALRRIPLELQMLLELHYWEELKIEELAELLDIPRGTVKSRLFRAREEIRKAIARMADTDHLRQSSVQDFEKWVLRIRANRPP